MSSSEDSLFSIVRNSRLLTVVALLWSLILLGIFAHAIARPTTNTVFTTYRKAGERWLDSSKLYKGKRGFVYSPAAAAMLAPFAAVPLPLATIAWRLLNTGVFVGAVAWWLRTGLHRGITRELYGWVFLALLPLTLGNIHIAQVNPLIIGLLMFGILGCHEERWTLAAVCIGIATYFKIYPLAVGLLLVLVYPKQFAWRLVAVLVGIFALSFVLQKPAYVYNQYRLWIETRQIDNRFEYNDDIASRDLWMIFRLIRLPITQFAYQILQAASGAAIGAVVLFGSLRRWPRDRVLVALFSLVSCWMLLLGPSTESATYVMLAPAVAFALVQALENPKRYSPAMRLWIGAAVFVFLLSLVLNAFFRLPRTPLWMSIQPFGAVIFCGYAIAALREKHWLPAEKNAAEPVKAAAA